MPPHSILIWGIEADILPTCARYGIGVIPYSPLDGGWLGALLQGLRGDRPASAARLVLAHRFDLSLAASQRKLDATEKLSELARKAETTLIQLALAFALRHPAVTAAIIGLRIMEHLESQLAAADIELAGDVLGRIGEIVPPGVTITLPTTGESARPCRRRPGAGRPSGAPQQTTSGSDGRHAPRSDPR